MSRTRFIGANWKMNPPPAGALESGSPYTSQGTPEIVVFPSFLDLRTCAGKLTLGAQYGRPEATGAFTGDVSMQMVKDAGASYVLCGHSERRRYHEENDAFIAAQVKAAIDVGLTAILCIGESADEQELKNTEHVLKHQLSSVIGSQNSRLRLRTTDGQAKLTAQNFLVAYEPVWAIGSGRTAVPTDAQAVHAFIRSLLPDAEIRIIYGGSVNGKNAKDFFSQPDIDGALVGGCSLKPDEFRAIVEAA